MGKINLNVKYCLENKDYEYNIKGIYQNNIIKYFADSKMLLDKEKSILTRITSNEEIVFDFFNSNCLITDLKTKQKVGFKINVLSLVNKENYFLVLYEIESKFKIEINIKGDLK